jgi:ABC-type antimicrobial peptide transport system permease subunit
MTVTLRGQGDPASLADLARRELRAVDPGLPIHALRTMSERVSASLAPRRFSMLLLSLFAGLALALGTIGTYGLMAYQVSQGRRELGIRLALGASPSRVLGFVLREGMSVALAGAAFGVVVALVLARVLASLLFGISAFDPLTFASVPLVLLLAALLACYLPARRAARVDPAATLRSE